MYNEEIKRKFIDSLGTTDRLKQEYIKIFNTAANYEKEFEMDMCATDGENLCKIITKITGVTNRSQATRMTCLRKYARWCLANNIPGACDAILNFDIESMGYEKIHRQMFANPTHLQKVLDLVFDPESKNTVDNTYRAYFWLAYAGVPLNDVFKLTKDNVNLKRMTVEINDERFPLEQQSKAALKNCVELTSFVFIHSNYTKNWDRFQSEQLLRGVKGDINYNGIKSFIRRARLNPDKTFKTNSELAYEHVKLSGMFYRLRFLEVQGIAPDFYDIARSEMAGKEYKLDNITNKIESLYGRRARQIEADYKRWKAAYPV